MIWKTRKSKLKCEKRWKIQRKGKLNSEKIRKWVVVVMVVVVVVMMVVVVVVVEVVVVVAKYCKKCNY
jgi:hypothetical protein